MDLEIGARRHSLAVRAEVTSWRRHRGVVSGRPKHLEAFEAVLDPGGSATNQAAVATVMNPRWTSRHPVGVYRRTVGEHRLRTRSRWCWTHWAQQEAPLHQLGLEATQERVGANVRAIAEPERERPARCDVDGGQARSSPHGAGRRRAASGSPNGRSDRLPAPVPVAAPRTPVVPPNEHGTPRQRDLEDEIAGHLECGEPPRGRAPRRVTCGKLVRGTPWRLSPRAASSYAATRDQTLSRPS